MSEPAAIYACGPATKQEQNPGPTGFDAESAARLVHTLAAGWREADRLDVVLCRALAHLTEQHPEQPGFDAWELAGAMGELRGRTWGAGDSREEQAAKVRKLWRRLEHTWATKEEGIAQSFADAGAGPAPRIARIEGGGSGRPTRYLLQPTEQGVAPTASRAAAIRNAVRYVCEDVDRANWLVRAFGRGILVAGWRAGLLRVLLVSAILVVAAGLIFLLVGGALSVSAFVPSAFAAAALAWMFYATIGPILLLPERRMALAPWWMQNRADDRLLEWRTSEGSHPIIKAVRYTAMCPCGGKIRVRCGGWRHLWNIVGICDEVPYAHVFAFDHRSRHGSQSSAGGSAGSRVPPSE